MNYQQHPLSSIFPAMTAEQINARLDGVIPMSVSEIDAVMASPWFQSLKKSQRAMYACTWYHMPARGTNQHKYKVDQRTPRFAAEAAQKAIAKAVAHA